MQTTDDIQLLQEFAATQSEQAFAALVDRYLNLVYSAALRQAPNAHDAEEIAQAVFLVLARKARGFRPGVVLSGWLYQTARLTAANFSRGNYRRQRREQEAYMESTARESDTSSASWTDVAPLLDEAMSRLSEKDRSAVVLRYFEDKDLAAIAAALDSSEDAAKMRLSRALDKLRDFFAKRGVPISSAGLAAIISEFSVQAAPVGLAASVTSGICGGATVAASTLTLAKGTLTMMAWTKISIGVAAVAIVAVGYQWHELSAANQRSADLEQQLNHQTELYNQQEATLKDLQASNSALAQQVEFGGQHASSQTAATSAKDSGATTTAGGPAAAPNKNFLAQMMSDPAMKKAMHDQQEWMIKKQYSALVKQLNLSPEQTDQFYSVLMSQQDSAMSNGVDIMSGANKAGAAQAAKDADAAADSQLQALLGDAGFSQYKDFKDGMADRMLLDQMTADFADNPLTSDQQQKLLQAMRTERENATQLPGQAATPTDPTDIAGTMSRAMQAQEQANQQVLQDAAAFLSPQQVQSLGNAQSNLLSLQKAGMAMAQSMFSGSNAPSQ